jgi:hypothetical protein
MERGSGICIEGEGSINNIVASPLLLESDQYVFGRLGTEGLDNHHPMRENYVYGDNEM